MADVLFGLFLRQRRARIYRYNDSILICSNQKLRTRCRFGRASIEQYKPHRDGFTEGTNCYYALKPIDQVLIALQFYASVGLLQVHLVVGDTTGGGKSTVSLAVHKHGRHIENNHSAYSQEIASVRATTRTGYKISCNLIG